MKSRIQRISFGLICLLSFTQMMFAGSLQDSVAVQVSFHFNESCLAHPEELDAILCHFNELADQGIAVKKIFLRTGASPEGNSTLNQSLSDRRAQSIKAHIQAHHSLADSIFDIHSVGEDYETLHQLVLHSDMPFRKEVLHILENTPQYVIRGGKIVDSRKRQLMNLDFGKVWFYMKEHFFPSLRNGAIVAIQIGENSIPTSRVVPVLPASEPISPYPYQMEVPSSDSELPVILESGLEKKIDRPFIMGIRSNLLYDLALVPNLGMEFYLGSRWTMGVDWKHAWWRNESRHQYWRIYGGDVSIRKYFGRIARETPMAGHHVGLLGQIYTYDFMVGRKGHLGGRPHGNLLDAPHWSASLEYGYALPIAEHWHLDFSLALGYASGYLYKYEYQFSKYVWQSTSLNRWIGPTKAEISLVWIFGR